MADSKITDLAAISSVAGTEELVGNDGGNDKKITNAQIYAYIKAAIEGLSDAGAIQDADSVVLLDNSDSDTLHPSTATNLATYVIAALFAKTAETAGADADYIPMYDVTESAANVITLANLGVYMLAELEPSILDISDKDALASPADGDLMLTVNGTTPKKTTFLQVKNSILGGIDTYLAALTAVVTTANTDLFYCTQAGTEKKMTLLQIVNHIAYPINGSGAAGYLADWSDADTLTNTYSVVTSFIASSNTEIATGKAVRDEMDTIINDATAMAAAVVNADTILIDDGAAGTQRKATFTQIMTWIRGELATASTELTIATGAIAVTQEWHTIDTESDGASDDLTTITGLTAGKWYTFEAENTARSVVFKHQANIFCNGAADLTLDSTNDLIRGFSPDGTKLICQLIQTD